MGLVQKETLVVSVHSRASGNRQTSAEEELLYWREKDRLRTKARQVERPDLRVEPKFLLYGKQDVKDRRVIFDILPCRNYKSGNRCMHGNACIYMLKVKGNLARGRKMRLLKEQLRFWKKKIQGCVSQNSDPKKSILRKDRDWTHRWDTRKILRTHLERNSNSGLKKAISKALSKKANLLSEILARRILRKEHLRKPHDKKSTPAKQHGIWRENI